MNQAFDITWKNKEDRWFAAGPVQITKFSYAEEQAAINMVIAPEDNGCCNPGSPDKISGKYRHYNLKREINNGELNITELMKMDNIENIKRRL